MTRLFGTDGVRGLAGKKLTASLALDLASAAGRHAIQNDETGYRLRALVGRDTRLSGEMLTSAVTAGFASAGVMAIDIGILPTPAVAYLASALNVSLAAVISASHNPFEDNGIKFITRDGFKLEDTVEDEIEHLLNTPWEQPTGRDIATVTIDYNEAQKLYVEYLLKQVSTPRNSNLQEISTSNPVPLNDNLPEFEPVTSSLATINSNGNLPLSGLKIVVDCANGAASYVGPRALRQAGATVTVINDSPDGFNINDGCGATRPEVVAKFTAASDADFGVAFDGDADRCIACDADGNIVNGDKILGILARAKKAEGSLAKDTLVLTVMSNLGLITALKDYGINVVTTGVGDRYVLEEMRKSGYNLGGEQSGHIINLDKSTTGDGVLTALCLGKIVKIAKDSGISFSDGGKKYFNLGELAAQFPDVPQVLINVKNVDKAGVNTCEPLQNAIAQSIDELGDQGRVLLRASGTEPLIRVMVEAFNAQAAKDHAEKLAGLVKQHLSL